LLKPTEISVFCASFGVSVDPIQGSDTVLLATGKAPGFWSLMSLAPWKDFSIWDPDWLGIMVKW